MIRKITELFNNIVEFFEIKVQELKLKTIQTTSQVLAILILIITISSLAFLFVLFSSFALGTLFNELLDSQYLGFLIVAGIYLLLIITIVILFQRNIINKWLQSLILKSLNKTKHDEH